MKIIFGKMTIREIRLGKRWIPFIGLIVKNRPLTGARSYAGFANSRSTRRVINATTSKPRVGQYGPKRINVRDGRILSFGVWKPNLF